MEKNKNINSRNEMNEKINNFVTPNYLKQGIQNTNTDFNNSNSNLKFDKNDYKNDINTRLNSFLDFENLNLRRLPLNNNIRDYDVTIDTKRDEVNERLSNYNKLASNMNPSFINSYNPENSFHNNFKEENNKRMEELSPLSRNFGLPINQEKPKIPDFTNSIENNQPFIITNKNNQYDINNENYNNNMNKIKKLDDYNINHINGLDGNLNKYTLLENDINNIRELKYNKLYPCDTRQQYNFKK